jgi:putative ABC transport system permease protein
VLHRRLLAPLRRLGRRPALLAVGIATLGIGIGAATTMFAVVDAVLLRPLPYPQPERLVTVWSHADRDDPDDGSPLSQNEAVEYGARARAFTAFAAFGWGQQTLLGAGEPTQLRVAGVGHRFFDVIGVRPVLGRTFMAAEDAPGRDGVVLLSHALWQQAFGGSPAVLGRKVVVGGEPCEVVGVMPAGFAYPARAAMWRPLAIDTAALDAETITSHGLNAVARLRPDVDVAAARRDLGRVVGELDRVYPGHFDRGDGVVVEPLAATLLGDVRAPLLALLGAVGFLLLLACANVANLLLLRAEERARELAMRRALGASPLRLLAGLLSEGLALSLAAAVVGLLASRLGLAGVRALLPANLPRADAIAVDWRVLAASLGVAVVTALLVSLAPALRLRTFAATALRTRTGSHRGSGRLADALVIGQVALALTLSTGAALAARSLQRLGGVDAGFEPAGVLTAKVALPESAAYGTAAQVQAFHDTVAEHLARDRRVVAVGAGSWIPYADYPSDWPVTVEGGAPPAEDRTTVDYTLVHGDYFAAMDIPLLAGRFLRAGDGEGARKAVVTRSFVAEWLDGRDPLGRQLRLDLDPTPYEIVGVVADQRLRGPATAPRPGVYLPHVELKTGGSWLPRGMTVVVRSAGEPEALAAALRSAVRAVDPDVPLADVRTYTEIEGRALGQARSLRTLLALFAGLGLLLGGVGSFVVAAAWVAQRRRDIGVRMALGARRRRVIGEVVARGLRLTAAGCALGAVAAWALARVAGARLLYEVAPADPVAFAAAATALVVVGLLATAAPARRASRIEPMRVLREE